MLRKQKEETVKKISSIFSENNYLIFINYNKFTASCMTSLKMQLKQGGANLKVVKNTLAKVAAKQSIKNNEEIKGFFEEKKSCGIIYGDIGFCAKEIKKFCQDNENIISVSGCMVDGEVFQSDKFEYFASLPSKEELKQKLEILLSAPLLALKKLCASPAISLKKIQSIIPKLQ